MPTLAPRQILSLVLAGLPMVLACSAKPSSSPPKKDTTVTSLDASTTGGGSDASLAADGDRDRGDDAETPPDPSPDAGVTHPGDSGSGVDAAPVSYEGIECASAVCKGGNICCEKPSLTCTSLASCGENGIKFVCDGPEDCAPNEDCCGYGGSTCTAKDPDNLICKGGDNYLCHTDAECGVGRVCCPAASTQWKVCRYQCTGD